MKLFLRIICTLGFGFGMYQGSAQCTATTLDWDNLSFLDLNRYTSLNATGTTFQNQTFAFGKNKINITHNFTATNTALGEDGEHTAESGSYGTGNDVHFIGNGTITLKFTSAVQNVKFSIYDVDVNQMVTITALNGSTAQLVSMSRVSTTLLTINGSGTTSASATASGTIDDNATNGTANVDIIGPVTEVRIVVSATGTKNGNPKEDGSFWLSDIQACSPGSFPINYQQAAENKPFAGQPSYFLATPDNNSVYMVDPISGKARELFKEAAGITYVNSFGYDPRKRILYYVTDGSAAGSVAANKKVKMYDFNTETISDFIPDITAIGIPTFNQGVESAAASFYDGALYLGIEGGVPNSTSNRESIVWRIDIDATGKALPAYQVFGVPSAGHDWGDFIMKDGFLYDFNTSQSNNYSGSQFKHFNLVTGALTNYNNPTVGTPYAGQAGMNWIGDLYSVRNGVQKYDLAGNLSSVTPITSISGTPWVGNAGDAAEAFRPKADFGDAPLSFDPDPLSPALHERNSNLMLGSKLDLEWERTNVLNTDADDDGLTDLRILMTSGGNYQTNVNVLNNTGVQAVVCAWIDFNGDNVFQTNEGISETIGSSASVQAVSLYWKGIASNLPNNSFTYLRVRTTSLANGMTAANPTGYFADGEVEDYYLAVNATTLATKALDFTATKENGKIHLKWTNKADNEIYKYLLERSADGNKWVEIDEVNATNTDVYSRYDVQPLSGKSFYRLRIIRHNGEVNFSEIRSLNFEFKNLELNFAANPSRGNLNLSVLAQQGGMAKITMIDFQGRQVVAKTINLQQGSTFLTLPLSALSPGQYIVHLQQGILSAQKQLVISK